MYVHINQRIANKYQDVNQISSRYRSDEIKGMAREIQAAMNEASLETLEIIRLN
jgi:hypothetical protein